MIKKNELNLITVQEAKDLSREKVHEFYKKYISKSQVSFFTKFGFGFDIIDSSLGSYLYTKDKKILDLTGGIGVLNHGHNNQKIINERINFQLEKRMEVHKLFFSQYLAALSHNIAQLLPGDLNRSFFPNSGAEAVEGAIKLAYKFFNGEKKIILYSDISFHGKTIAASSISGSKEINFNFQKIPNTRTYEYNNYELILSIIKKIKEENESCYAIIVEPLSASTLRQASSEFLIKLRDLCDKEKIILIFDEIYSGWCKTGSMFNFFRSNIIPDILVYAKSFGGGKASISGYTARENIMKKAYDNQEDFLLQSSTYNGFGEETITAIEAINVIVSENYEEKSQNVGKKLEQILRRLKQKYPEIIDDIRGSGCFYGFTLKKFFKLNETISQLIKKITSNTENKFLSKLLCAAIINKMYTKYNILTFGSFATDVVYKISPEVNIDDKSIDYFEKSLDQTLSEGYLNLIKDFLIFQLKK